MKKLFLCLLFCSFSASAATATLYAKSAGGNWSAAGTWSTASAAGADNSGPPDATTNVIFEFLSGNVTIDAAAVCRSLDCTSGTGNYTGTITHNASVGLSIGDATAGAGNVALKLVAGMTWSVVSNSGSTISFISTSATQQTITSASHIFGNIILGAAGSNYLFSDVFNTAYIFSYANGSLDTGNNNFTCFVFSSSVTTTRSLTLGTSTVLVNGGNSTWVITGTNLTLSAASSTINVGTFSNGSFSGGGKTYGTVNFTTVQDISITDTGNTFGTLTRTGGNEFLASLTITGTQTVTGTLTLAGNAANKRLLVRSATLGTAATITNSGATMTWSNVDFRDITLGTAFDASAITGKSGDCGGNTNITFTTGATQYWFKDTASWSTIAQWFLATAGGGGAGRVPLPQDDVVFDASSFSAGSKVVTVDEPRIGKSINWTGTTNTPDWAKTTACTVYGSVTLVSGMTLSGTTDFTFEGRGAFLFTSAGLTWTNKFTVQMIGGTLTLQDALTSGTAGFFFNNGTLNANNFNVTILAGGFFNSNNSSVRTLLMGSGTWTVAGTGNVWTIGASNLTFTSDGSTLAITNTTSTSKTFICGGLTYNDLTITGGGTGAVIFTGNNTWRDITVGAPKTLTFTSGSTNTLRKIMFNTSAGNVVTINSTTGGSAATLSKPSGVIVGDYLSIQDSTATGGAIWYAGYTDHSTNVSGNSGWRFTILSGANQAVFCGM